MNLYLKRRMSVWRAVYHWWRRVVDPGVSASDGDDAAIVNDHNV